MRQISVELRNPYVPWSTARNSRHRAWARGYAFRGAQLLEATDLAKDLATVDLAARDAPATFFARYASALNGSFALVLRTSDGLWAMTDSLRSIPLFYGIRDGSFLLADDAETVRSFLGATNLDGVASTEFLLTGYVTGTETLYPGVLQVQASELIQASSSAAEGVQRHRYFRFFHHDHFGESLDELIGKMDAVALDVFRRLLESAKGRRIVIPLSGGYDSRMIATMLRRLGYDNVLCFAYGARNSWEPTISEEVSRRLGFPWRFEPWTRRMWREWYRGDERKKYTRYGGNYVSNAFVADWPLVGKMLRGGILKEEDVLVPGHSGDFLGGSHLPTSFLAEPQPLLEDVVDAVLRRHYSLWDWRGRNPDLARRIRIRVRDRMEPEALPAGEDVTSAFEKWDWQERQSKFIVNSVRAYEYWGLDWRVPLWDHALMDFFLRVPLSLRVQKKLYDGYTERSLFPRFGVSGLERRITFLSVAYAWAFGPKTPWDPRLGRYRAADFIEAWRRYGIRFGGRLRNRKALYDPIALGAAVSLHASEDRD